MERSIISSTSTCSALTRALSHLFGAAEVPSLKAQSLAVMLSHLNRWQTGELELDPNLAVEVLSSPLGLRILHRAQVLLPLMERLADSPVGIDLSVNQLLNHSELGVVLSRLQAAAGLTLHARSRGRVLHRPTLRTVSENGLQLRRLSLKGEQLSGGGLALIDIRCTRLVSLELRGLRENQIEELRIMPSRLTSLRLEGLWTDSALANVLGRCSALTMLHLSGLFGPLSGHSLRSAKPPLIGLHLRQRRVNDGDPLLGARRHSFTGEREPPLSRRSSLVRLVQRCTALQSLELRHFSLVHGFIGQIMGRCKQLQSLEVRGIRLRRKRTHAVRVFPPRKVMRKTTTLGRLTDLSLVYQLGAYLFVHLEEQLDLRSLTLVSDLTTDETVSSIAHACGALRSVRLTGEGVTVKGVRELVNNCTCLTSLNLLGVPITSGMLEAIGSRTQWRALAFGRPRTHPPSKIGGKINRKLTRWLPKWPQLTDLGLHRIGVSANLLRQLADCCGNLRRLSLRGGPMPKGQAPFLEFASRCSRLEMLELCIVALEPAAYRKIAQALPCLRRLRLHCANRHPIAAEALRGLHRAHLCLEPVQLLGDC